MMAYLPVESIISEKQEEYYAVLGQADKNCDCTPFIEFMLDALENALRESV
jgi:Fic family protein